MPGQYSSIGTENGGVLENWTTNRFFLSFAIGPAGLVRFHVTVTHSASHHLNRIIGVSNSSQGKKIYKVGNFNLICMIIHIIGKIHHSVSTSFQDNSPKAFLSILFYLSASHTYLKSPPKKRIKKTKFQYQVCMPIFFLTP